MADVDKLATFQSITGADDETAQHVVESFGGDLDRAVNFFLENGEQGVATLQSFRPPAQPQTVAQPAPIDLEEDDEPVLVPSQSPQMDASAQFAAQQEAAAEHRRNQGWLEEEAALQQALEASKVTAGSAGPSGIRGTSTPGGSASLRHSASERAGSDSDVEEYEPEMEEDSDMEMDTEEEYMAKLAAAQAQAQARRRAQGAYGGAGPSGGPSFFGGLDGADDDAGPRIRSNRPSGAAAAASQHLQNLNAFSQRLGIPMPPMPGTAGPPTRPGGFPDDAHDEFGDGAGPSGLGMPAGTFGGAGFAGGRDAGLPDMPAGVDVEEARMLEAMMLGIPYTGRMPDFAAGAGAAAGDLGDGGAADGQPLSPGMRGTRALREEQDWAYQESLQADREKAAAEEAAQRAAEQESARMAAEAEAEAAAAAEAESRRVQTLADKAQALPPEPPAGSADTVSVLIRLPNGQRRTRRFLKTDKLQSLYDFVDTSEPGQELQPGSYLLVTNMPRKVYEETVDQTLADAGLTQRQEMLLLEPK